jgi:hypothetical protein
MNIITSPRKFLVKGGVVIAASAFIRAGLFGAETEKKGPRRRRSFARGGFDARAWRIETCARHLRPGAVHSESLNMRRLAVTETAHWDTKLASLPEM